MYIPLMKFYGCNTLFENVSKDTETACTANDPRCIGEHRDYSNGRDWNEYVSVQNRNGYFGKTYHSG